MGLLAQRWEGADELRFDRAAWISDEDDYATGRMSSAGVRVNRAAALGLTTVWRCVDLLSSAVSMSPRDVLVKVGGKSFPEYSPPSWISTPNPADPSMTGNDYFAQVALSLLLDGNFFTHVYPHVFDPQVLTVLDPQRIDVKPGPIYEVKDATGRVVNVLTPADMLHGTWFRLPGALRGVSPLEALRGPFGTALATQEHAGRFFGQGASLSFGVEVPGPMDPGKKAEMAETLKRKYAGISNSHAIGVLTNGAKFVAGLAPTPEQAQMLASREFAVEDIARIYGVPAALAGSTQPGAASYAAVEAFREELRTSGVGPLAVRIETQHDRLLSLPVGLADSSASVQFRFNLDWIARTNLLARYQAHGEGVKMGFLTPNEARDYENLPALPGGDLLYMFQQQVPLADLGKTKATEPLDTQPKPAGVPQ